MTKRIRARRIVALLGPVTALAGASGCGKFAAPATQYAAVEEAATGALAPLAEMPYRLCLRRAQYSFLAERMMLQLPSADAADEAWPGWYAKAEASVDLAAAGRPVTWKRDCDDQELAGQGIRTVLRALRAHARALAAFAASKTFDASALQDIASSGATLARAAGADSSVGSQVTGAGNALASFSSTFVAWYRQGKLEEAVEASDGCMNVVFDKLLALLDALSNALTLATTERRAVVGRLRDKRWQAAGAPWSTIGQSFELSQNIGAEFDREARSLVRYRATVERLAASHHALAQLARSKIATSEMEATLNLLSSAIDDLTAEEWNR